MKIKVITQKDIDNQLQQTIKGLTDNDKTNFVWDGKPLYKIDHGHCFGRGFYIKYTTLDAIVVIQYGSRWFCNDDEYRYDKETGIYDKVIIEKVETNDIDFNEVIGSFPVVKSVSSKSISDDLIPIKPIDTKNE